MNLKPLALILGGLVLSLVVLELGLRLAGWTLSSYQQYANNKALRNKSQYTIMCLGESTTARQYPVQLQQLLNEKYPNKFSVIDCAVPATNLETILNNLDNNINKYHPDIAICMMGGLDITEFNHKTSTNQNIFLKLKIIKIFIEIKKYFKTKNNSNLFAYTHNEKQLVNKLILDLKFKQAEQILKEILKNNPDDEEAFIELTILYGIFLHYDELAYNMAIEGLGKKSNLNKDWYYSVIFRLCYKNNDMKKLKYYIDNAINKDISIFSSNQKYFLYSYVKNYISEEQKDKILKVMIQNGDMDLGLMAIEYLNKKEYEKAEECFNKAEELRLNFPNTEVYNLYKLIIKKLINNNIKVICMQYPVRSIKPLQEQLKAESYYDKITFISNEKLFKDALKEKPYNDLFTDQFGGDFGHCTNLGNTMIAENIISILEKLYN